MLRNEGWIERYHGLAPYQIAKNGHWTTLRYYGSPKANHLARSSSRLSIRHPTASGSETNVIHTFVRKNRANVLNLDQNNEERLDFGARMSYRWLVCALPGSKLTMLQSDGLDGSRRRVYSN
eukprot:scaffold2021_cov176-Amphora_coffeaeformis.AAC.1